MLGGRSRGGMRDPAKIDDGAGKASALVTGLCHSNCATGIGSGWKILTRHVPMSGQTFCGQLGQCLVDFVFAACIAL